MEMYGLVNERGVFNIPTEYADILSLKEGYRNRFAVVDHERKCADLLLLRGMF